MEDNIIEGFNQNIANKEDKFTVTDVLLKSWGENQEQLDELVIAPRTTNLKPAGLLTIITDRVTGENQQ